MVHFFLSQSYLLYFYTIILGVFLDIIFPSTLFSAEPYKQSGWVLIILGSILIYWAQHTARQKHYKKEQTNPHEGFASGPYKYTRAPTQVGLTLMTLGLGFLFGSVFIVLLVFLTFIFSKTFFLKKEEHLLEEKYGEAYTKYKEKVKL